MSPGADLIKWIALIAVLAQIVAVVIQFCQGGRSGVSAGCPRGVSAGIRIGFVALVFELIAWLLVGSTEIELSISPWIVYSPAVLAGTLAVLGCVSELMKAPPMPDPPQAPDAPLSPQHMEAYRLELARRQAAYERALAESKVPPARSFSLVMGAFVGVAVVFTSLYFSRVVHF